MAESEKDRVIEEDGCVYMTEEEVKKLFTMLVPAEFNSSSVKNRALDVQYGKLPEQKIDIYMPENGDGPYPVVFYVHGGGWTMGTKTMGFLSGVIGLIEHGYAVISVDYRLAPKTTFPEFIFDVKTAVRWARAHAGEYGFDAAHFGMAGDSAGGHITLMLGFTAGRPEYAGEEYGWPGFPDGLQAICDMYGPSILAEPMAKFYSESGVARLSREAADKPNMYELAFGTGDTNLLRLISPITLVHKDIPPVLIMHGVKDGVVPYQHSVLLDKRIKEVCGESRSELIMYDDRNHADHAFNTVENSDALAGFFDHYLK